MAIDVDRARAETPGCDQVVHLNNAGASLMPTPVLDAVVGHLRLEAARGGYEAAAAASERIEGTYSSVAALLGCAPHEVALVESATRAWDMAFYAVPFSPGDRILTGRAEYGSNVIAFAQVARRTGAVVEVVPDDEHGQVSVEALAEMLDDNVRLVAVTHVPSQSGLVNPAAAVGRVARDAGVLFLLDACQSVGQMPVDVSAIGCDLLAAPGRKFLRAPRGTAFLYVREELVEQLEPPLLDLRAATLVAPDGYRMRDDARRFEAWEANQAARIGLGVAVDYAMGWGLDAIEARVSALAEALRAGLAQVPGVRLHDPGRRRCGIVTFTVAGQSAVEVARRLAGLRVNVWVSRASQGPLDLPHRDLADVVRASVHYFNTEDELDRLCALVATGGRSQ